MRVRPAPEQDVGVFQETQTVRHPRQGLEAAGRPDEIQPAPLHRRGPGAV